MKYPLLIICMLAWTITTAIAQTNIPNGVSAPATATPKLTTTYYRPDLSPNYQRVLVPLVPTQDSSKIKITKLPDSVLVTTQYFDPVGRPFETIIRGASPAKKDFVAVSLYDEFSRQNTSYLPFTEQVNNTSDGLPKLNPVQDDSIFYKVQISNENIYYGQTTYDASPLQRVLKTTAPGNSWTGANIGTSSTWRSNTISDSVRLWTIVISTEDDVPSSTATYAAGSLMVTQMTDERGIKSVVYTDELGRKVLAKTQLAASPTTGHTGWLCTYYVYDEMNHLRMTIPPKAVDTLNYSTINWNLSGNATINNNLCYAYWYDSRGRVTMKRIPGAGKSYMAYDLYDRPVMTQDANLRSSNQWSFISYDGQSRPDTIGLITSALSKDTILAQAGRSLSYPVVTGTYTLLNINYYDDYSWISPSGSPLNSSLVTTNINSTNFNTSYNTAPLYPQTITQSNRTRGMPTGSRIIVLNSSTWLWSVNIFDDHGRSIQSKKINYTGGTDVATVQYGYAGRVLSTHLAHQKNGSNSQSHTVLTKYSYDHAGRVLTVIKNLDNLANKTISTYTYNELGQPLTKNFGNNIDSQRYVYNMRGWLQSINSSFVTTAGSTSNYFGEIIARDYGFTNSQVNGNIAGTSWKARGDGIARAYGYSYDNTNRLTMADFSQQNSGASSWTKDKVDFTVSGLNYDKGGNILSMKQVGLLDGSPVTVDSLSYQYFANSNQLQKVADGAGITAPLGDFKDTTYTGDDYAYDPNGNTTKDYNKRVTTTAGGNGIVYNFLNKPDSVVVSSKAGIHYYYDAAGSQLRKQINDYTTGTTISKNYLYIGGFVYLNDTLQYVLQEEGQIRYARKTNSSTGAIYYAYEYDYFIKDHQGNIRTILTEGRDTATYSATMESKDSIVVANTWSNVYSPINTVYAKPTAFDTDTSNHKVSLLNAASSGPMVGPSIVLKVMAGDQVQINTYAYYNTAAQPPQSGTNLLNSIMNILGTEVIGASGSKFGSGELTGVSNALNPDITNFLSSGRTYDTTKPKAYLNWVLLDDQLNYVSTNSGVVQVIAGSSRQALVAPTQNISKNGYLYVYVSNESPQNVYFDNVTVKQFTGPLQQEQSYYPHGLPMAGISDRQLLKPNTSYKANGGVELEEDYALEYYNTLFRKYDVQIGRFVGVDALSEQTAQFTPYQFGGNNPAMFNDPSGLLQRNPEDIAEGYKLMQQGGGGSWVENSFNAMDEMDGFREQSENFASSNSPEAYAQSQLFFNALIAECLSPSDAKLQGESTSIPNIDNALPQIPLIEIADKGAHSSELAQYGQVTGGSCYSVIIGTVLFEYGYVSTNKYWYQKYYTCFAAASVSASANVNAFTVNSRDGYNTTFSDWKGPVAQVGISYGWFGASYGWSTTYTTISVGAGYGFTVPKIGTAMISYGTTYLIGDPYFSGPNTGDGGGHVTH